MKLTELQKRILEAHLKRHLRVRCAVCGDMEFGPVDELYVMVPYGSTYPLTDVASIPLVAMVCAECGHISTFSALAVGLVKVVEVDAPAQEEMPN